MLVTSAMALHVSANRVLDLRHAMPKDKMKALVGKEGAQFEVLLNGMSWLHNRDVCFDGFCAMSKNKDLRMMGHSSTTGADNLGCYQGRSTDWETPTNVRMRTRWVWLSYAGVEGFAVDAPR